MAQANPFDQFDQTTSAPTPRPVYGAPPKPEKPDAPKTTWRQGVVNGKPVQISSEGKVEALPGDAGGNPNSLDPKTIEGQRNIATGILKNTGVNLQTGDDPVSELILNSTSGWLQTRGAEVYGGLTGDATSGMEAIGKLKPMLADMTLQMTGGSLGNQISDGDRKFIMERMGNIADPEVPADQRLASWEEVKRRLAQMSGIEMPAQMEQGEEGLSGSVTDDSPMAPTGNNAPPTGGNGGGGSFWQGIGAGVGDLVEGGVNNTVGLIVNPINTVAGRAMGYEGYTSDIGQTIRDALQLPEGNQTVSAINQAAAGGLSVGGLSRKAGQVLGNASLRAFGNNPLLDAATGATAAASGEVARQSGAGPVGQSVATLAGGFAPSAAIGGRNALLGVMGRNPPRGPAPDMAVVEAGQRQGVPIRQADARPELRGDFANLQTGQYAGPMVNQARQADNAIVEQRVAEVGGQGSPSDQYALGTRVQAAGDRYIASTKAQADRLYKRAKDLAAGETAAPATNGAPTAQTPIPASRGGWVVRDKETGTPVMETFDESVASKVNTVKYEVVPSRQHLEQFNAAVKQNGGQPPEGWNKAFRGTETPRAAPQAAGRLNPSTYNAPNADAVLEANIQELRAAGENSNAAAIKYLEGLRSDLRGGLSIDSMLNLRSNMRGQISERGLTGTDTDRRVRQVIDAMNTDLAEQLPAEASAALRAADAFYRKRQEFINGTLKQFMGDRGNRLPAETAATRLLSITQGKGNYDRFAKMWGQLEDGEKADVAATIAASLGRKGNGDFSPATLIRSLDPVKGINPRTARLVFGEEGAKALNDLRLIAQAKTDTANALNNSKTGVMVNRASGGLRSLLLGGLGFSTGGPAGAIAAPIAEGVFRRIGEERAARLMLNPDFTKWLRAMPEATNPKAINAYFGKLKASAARSQVAANDVEAFTAAVMEAFAQSPRRAAAQEEDN